MNDSTAVATTQAKPEIVKFREQLENRASELRSALPSHISPEKFQRTVITAAQQNPDLLTVDRQSLVLACMKAAHDALLPDGRESAIIPFKENRKVNGSWQTRMVAVYMPMVYGLRKKILQSGEVVALEVGVVYRKEVEAGHFYYEVGKFPPLGHRPMLDLTIDDTTDDQIVGAYSIATMKDGTKSYEFMRRFEIDKVRECSQTGATRDRSGKERKPSGPWVEWFPEQCKKTVMRRHSKTLPQSGDVIIDVEGRELETGMSTAALLDSHPGGAPERIEDHSDDPPHDSQTGEIIEGEASSGDQPGTNTQEASGTAREAPGAEESSSATSGKASASASGDKEPTKEDKEAASRIIADIKAAKTVDAARSAYLGSELELAAMPEALSELVDNAYEAKRGELRKAKAEPEPAK